MSAAAGAVLAALALSPGPGHPVCGRAVYDRAKAAQGGAVLVAPELQPGDEPALRMSEALLTTSAGLSGRAAVLARRQSVPAAAVPGAFWSGSALVLPEPVLGPERCEAGACWRPVVGARRLELREGDALCVDAPAGRVTLVPAGLAEDRIGAAEAARAYEGLRDAGALERWLRGEPRPARAAFLLEELVPRAVEGAIDPAELPRLRRAALAAAGAESARLRAAERAAFARARRAALSALRGCAADAADAASGETLERMTDSAAALAARVSATARALGLGDGGAGAAAKACEELARRRRGRVPDEPATLEQAAAAAGADSPAGQDLPAGLWERFVAENGLEEFIARTVDDASLGLRRKSERLRARILEGRVPVEAPFAPALVAGPDAAVPAPDAAAFPRAVKEAWAASWAPGPLGARLRAGRGAAFDGRLRALRADGAAVEGLAFSRDPGTGRRGRVIVEAGGDRYALERRSGRQAEPARLASPEGKPALTPAQLARVARLARALDAWKGAGVELSFAFSDGRLLLRAARALEPPRPVRPLLDPFSPRPAPETLNVRPVR